jgi:hypothetical protein
MTRWATVIVKSLIGIALLLLLSVLIDVPSTLRLFWEANLGLIAIVFVWLVFDRALNGWRWIILVRSRLKGISELELFHMFFISSFLGNFVPFIGGDATRVAALARRIGTTLGPLSSVIVDRFLGFVSVLVPVLLIIVGAAFWRPTLIGLQITWLAVAVSAAIIITVALVFISGFMFKIVAKRRNKIFIRFVDRIESLIAACKEQQPAALGRVFVIIQISMVNAIVTSYLVSIALGIDVDLIYFFLFIPVIIFLGQLPISANGLGISEGAFVFFFTQVGALAAEALALGVAIRVLMTLVSLPGGLLLLVYGWPCRELPISKSLPGDEPV